MLPVIPAFLAQLVGTSLDHSDLQRRDVLVSTILLVISFSAVFAALGVVLGTVLQDAATGVLTWLARLAGTVVILLRLDTPGADATSARANVEKEPQGAGRVLDV